MPWYATIYVLIILGVSFGSSYLNIQYKRNLFIIIVQIFSGLILVMFVVVHYQPDFLRFDKLAVISLIFLCLVVEYITFKQDMKFLEEDLGEPITDIEVKVGSLISLVIIAPAYIAAFAVLFKG